MFQMPLNVQLDDSARLDNYFPDGNDQVFDKLTKLNKETQNFIFLWGNNDVGKSHLAQAICREFYKKNLTAVYFPLNNHELKPEVLDGLEFADLVCLDAIEMVIGKPEWEQSIFNLFNSMKHSLRQFVIFSRLSPRNLSCCLADLASRLSSMEVYKINPLNDEQTVAFVIEKGKNRGLNISIDVAHFLLHRNNRDVGSLVKIVELLDKQSLAFGRKITIPFVKKVLKI